MHQDQKYYCTYMEHVNRECLFFKVYTVYFFSDILEKGLGLGLGCFSLCFSMFFFNCSLGFRYLGRQQCAVPAVIDQLPQDCAF